MDFYYIVGGSVVLSLINIFVSALCFRRDDLDVFQKCSQSIIVWVIPIIGAILIYSLNDSNDQANKPHEAVHSPYGEPSGSSPSVNSGFGSGEGGSD
jgi:hypothetical protein